MFGKKRRKVMPPTCFWISFIHLVCLYLIFRSEPVIPSPYRYLGMVLIVFGIVMNLWADSLFRKKSTTVKPYENPTFLITSGPFRMSRHPMYLGMALILIGMAMLLGSLASFIFPLTFIIIMERRFIPMEEGNLEKVFGAKYRSYKKRVRRWI